MKASDYIASFLKRNGVKYVFGLQGGAVVHLFDSIDATDEIEPVYCHHEQAAALAAVAHSKVSGNIGCVVVTTGPGSTNTLTGLLAAWQDSIPVIFISGQTRVEHCSYGKKVRQVGSQEFAIVDAVKTYTKFACCIENSSDIRSIFEKATQIAISGRPGPVWIDIPVNLQWQDVDEKFKIVIKKTEIYNEDNCEIIINAIKDSKQPLIVAGYGIHSSNTENEFLQFITTSNIPYVSTWTASDLSQTDFLLNNGVIGVAGQRGANKLMYECDLMICFGTHLSVTHTGNLFDEFAVNSKKIGVNIDPNQINNYNIKFDHLLADDLANLLPKLVEKNRINLTEKIWIERCLAYKKLNSCDHLNNRITIQPYSIDSNLFIFTLSKSIPENSNIVIDGGGTALYAGFQSLLRKKNQRIICSSAISAMGTGLPEAVGVSLFNRHIDTYCIIGDGSLMLNLQELQTIIYHSLPIKIIVMNNEGYLAIRHTQSEFLGGRYTGTGSTLGISFPSIQKLAYAFDFPYLKVSSVEDLQSGISQIINHKGFMMIEVINPKDQEMLFQQGFIKQENGTNKPHPLSEMRPFI